MIVYKAVTVIADYEAITLDYGRHSNLKMLSRYFHDSNFALEYKLNQDTYPRIGKIFCYSRLPEDRSSFMPINNNEYNGHAWLKCITDSVEPCDVYIPSTSDTKIVTDYWTRQMLYDTFVMQPPNNTVLCNWIKPIEIL